MSVMTAVPLFDALARRGKGPADETALTELAARLAQSLLDELERIREYEVRYGPADYDAAGLEIARTIHRMFEQWAAEAEQVLLRMRNLAAEGHQVGPLESVEDAYGQVRARLALTPEQTARALDQSRQGLSVPVQELRNELRARNRA